MTPTKSTKDTDAVAEIDSPTDIDNPTETTTPTSKPRRGGMGWLVAVLVLAAAGAALWYGYQVVVLKQAQQLHELTRQYSTLEQQFSQLQQDLKSQNDTFKATVDEQIQQSNRGLQRALNEQADLLESNQMAVRSVQAELAQLDITQQSSWRIFEARALAERAASKLWIEQDIAAAVELLKLADSHLRALSNPAHQAVRQALADDILRLSSLPAQQSESITLTLGSLRNQLQHSHWYQQPTAGVSNSGNDATASGWQRFKQSFTALMDKLIRVQRRDTPVQPLIADTYFTASKERVLLQLQLAQQAALSGSQQVFEQALATAIEQLTTITEISDNADIEPILEQLMTLQAAKLQPELPAQLPAVALLSRLADQYAVGQTAEEDL